jgi:hypothetical protein
MPDAPTRNCIRCKQPLPAGTGYCVACGCTNDGVMDDKYSTVGKQMEERATWEAVCRVFPWLRIFK